MTSLSEEVEESSREQVYDHAARKIVGKIKSARIRGDIAERRFLWELLQNACDTAVACGRTGVNIRIDLRRESFTFSHDAGGFKVDEIAALILGGSAKPFDNSDLTGRFGTGFLLSHAVSCFVRVIGFVRERPGGFSFTLRREGDEASIRKNFDECKRELDKPVEVSAGRTQFEYELLTTEGADVAQQAIILADRLLPYVFAFNSHLRRVDLFSPNLVAKWERNRTHEQPLEGSGVVTTVHLVRTDHEDRNREIDVLVNVPIQKWLVAAVIDEDGFRPLGPNDPRVYFHFPLEQSADVGLPVAIHGPFDVDEGRTVPNFNSSEKGEVGAGDANARLFREIFRGLPPFLGHLARFHANGKLQALEARQVPSTRADFAQWSAGLRGLVDSLICQKIVMTSDEATWLAPKDCRFPMSVVGDHAKGLEVDVEEVWKLGKALGFELCSAADAKAWEKVISGWQDLGIRGIKTLNVEDLIEEARTAGNLPALGARLERDVKAAQLWLRSLLDLLAPYRDQVPVTLLDRILPNQNGTFSACSALQIDRGVDSSLKEIAAALNDDIRAVLLDSELCDENAVRLDLVGVHVQQSMTKEQAAVRVVGLARHTINEKLTKAGRKIPDDDGALSQCVALAAWLARNRPTFDGLSRDLPFITAEGTKADVEPGRDPRLFPIEAWVAEARGFADVFPESSRLSSRYFEGAAGDWPTLASALVEWGVAVPEPLMVEEEFDLKSELVSKIVCGPLPASLESDKSLPCKQVSRIPLLGDVVGRIGKDEGRARRFFEFIVKYLIHRDERWQKSVSISLQSGELLLVRPSEWLGRIKRDRWVPDLSLDEADRGQVPATRDSLKLLVPWADTLNDERCFEFLALLGFDRLEVWIRSTSGGDETAEQRLRDELASVAVDATQSGVGLNELVALVQKRRELQRKVASNRDFGLMIQTAIEEILKSLNLNVALVDHGYDFEVYERGEADAETDIGCFAAGKYLVEVKAISGNSSEVRLTPLQARTSVDQSANYVVCVVDIRGLDRASLQGSQGSILQISQRARIIAGVGDRLQPLLYNVDQASSGTQDVRIDQAQQLRYCLSENLWTGSARLDEWVRRNFSIQN